MVGLKGLYLPPPSSPLPSDQYLLRIYITLIVLYLPPPSSPSPPSLSCRHVRQGPRLGCVPAEEQRPHAAHRMLRQGRVRPQDRPVRMLTPSCVCGARKIRLSPYKLAEDNRLKAATEVVIFLYLLDNETSKMIVIGCFSGMGVTLWKIYSTSKFTVFFINCCLS